MKRARLTVVAALAIAGSSLAAGAEPARDAVDPALRTSLERIRETAQASDWAWRQLEELTDRVGPRLSGSLQNAAAVAQVPPPCARSEHKLRCSR